MKEKPKHNFLYPQFEAGFNGLTRMYDFTLRLALSLQFVTVAVAVLLLGGTFWLFQMMPTGFIPSQDSGFFFAFDQAGRSVLFLNMSRHQYAIARVAQADPNILACGSFLTGGTRASSSAA